MQHDRYDEDILKQLKRIATALEKIERKMEDTSTYTKSSEDIHINEPFREDQY